MSFQLKRGDEVIDGFRVLEPICEKQEYAIYRVEDGAMPSALQQISKRCGKMGIGFPMPLSVGNYIHCHVGSAI